MFDLPSPLPREREATRQMLRIFTWNPRPQSGLDCLMCAEFARQRNSIIDVTQQSICAQAGISPKNTKAERDPRSVSLGPHAASCNRKQFRQRRRRTKVSFWIWGDNIFCPGGNKKYRMRETVQFQFLKVGSFRVASVIRVVNMKRTISTLRTILK